MNKVITVNLNGNAYQLEEGGYETLRRYLETAAIKLATNPDKDEIISDIERAIAEKFRALLSAYKNVVSAKEVSAALAEVGPIDDGSESEPATPPPVGAAGPQAPGANAYTGAAAKNPSATGESKSHLHRLNAGAMLGGVCSGLGAHFGVDATVIRLIFVLITACTLGLGAILYVVLVFVLPPADAAAEKAAAQRDTVTAQDLIQRAKDGYYEAMKSWPNKDERRALKKKFKREMGDLGQRFKWEMEVNSAQWQRNWHRYWSTHQPGPGVMFALPVLSVLNVLILIFFFIGVISLLKSGTLLGLAIPGTIPVWLAIVLLILVYKFVAWPLKLARYAIWSESHGGRRYPPHIFADTFVWLALLAVAAWFIYPQQTHEVIQNIPPTVQHAIESVKTWWAHRT